MLLPGAQTLENAVQRSFRSLALGGNIASNSPWWFKFHITTSQRSGLGYGRLIDLISGAVPQPLRRLRPVTSFCLSVFLFPLITDPPVHPNLLCLNLHPHRHRHHLPISDLSSTLPSSRMRKRQRTIFLPIRSRHSFRPANPLMTFSLFFTTESRSWISQGVPTRNCRSG